MDCPLVEPVSVVRQIFGWGLVVGILLSYLPQARARATLALCFGDKFNFSLRC